MNESSDDNKLPEISMTERDRSQIFQREIKRGGVLSSLMGIGSIAALSALTWWMFKDLARVHEYVDQSNVVTGKKEPTNIPQKSTETKKNMTEQEMDLLIGDKTVHPIIQVEWLIGSTPKPAGKYEFDDDFMDIQKWKKAIKERTVSYSTAGMTATEIEGLWDGAGRALESLELNRKKIAELNFHTTNDPRMIAIFRKACEVMGQKENVGDILQKHGLQIKLFSIGEELLVFEQAYRGHVDLEDNTQGVIHLNSNAIVSILEGQGSPYILGVGVLSNESCHKVRLHTYGSWDKYLSAYKDGWPESAISEKYIPKEVVRFYDGVFTKNYGSNSDTFYGRIENESFYVGFMTTHKVLEEGVVIQLDRESTEFLGWAETYTK